MKQYDVIVITAHPDDAFLGAGGLMLKMQDQGLQVLVITVTDGDNLYADSVIRTNEFYKAIDFCGLEGYQMHYPNENLQFQLKDLCHAIHEILHDANPRLIITHNRFDQHTDHRTVSFAVKTAKDMLFHSLRELCRLKFILFFQPIRINLDVVRYIKPQLLCDISAYYKTKSDAVSFHTSQMPYLNRNLNIHIALNRFFGSLLSCEYAEGYNVLCFNNSISTDFILEAL